MTIPLQRCALDPAGLAAVAERYAAAATSYRASAEIRAAAATIELRGPNSTLAELLEEMVARESGCCSHLTFDIAETDGGYRVTLGTTQPGQPARADLAAALAILFPTAEITAKTG